MKKFRNYRHLFKRLQDPKAAAAYLNAALEDEDPKVFLIALKDIADGKRRRGQTCERDRSK